MLQRATLQVLAEAAEIGLPEAATLPAASFDPILRPMIKKRVLRAVEDAAAKARANAPGDHVLRLAFLLASASPEVLDANDDRAVEKQFDTLSASFRPPRPQDPHPPGGAYRAAPASRDPLMAVVAPKKRTRRFWPVTTPLVLVTLLAALGVSAVFLVPMWLPTPLQKFRGTPLGTAMGEPVTNLVVKGQKLDADSRDKILSSPVQKQVGEDAFKDLEQIVHLTPRIGEGNAETTDQAMAPLFAVINAFNEKARQKDVPALFHAYGQGQAKNRNVWLTTFFVERREELKLGDIDLKIAWGRRLDHLNLLDSEVYKANGEDWAILSLVLLDEEFVQTLLTPVAKEQPMGPTEYREDDKSSEAELARVAGREVGREIIAKAKISPGDANDLHRAIAQRNEIIVSLAKLGYGLKPSSGIEVSQVTQASMKRSAEQHPEDRALIQDFLRLCDRTASSRRVVAPAIAALGLIKEEEFVARFDAEKRYQKSDRKELEGIDARSRGVAAGELALLTRAQAFPKLALWRASRQALNDVGAYDALRALFVELGLMKPDQAENVTGPFEKALAEALTLPDERVRAAAEATYRKMFGEAPQALVRIAL